MTTVTSDSIVDPEGTPRSSVPRRTSRLAARAATARRPYAGAIRASIGSGLKVRSAHVSSASRPGRWSRVAASTP